MTPEHEGFWPHHPQSPNGRFDGTGCERGSQREGPRSLCSVFALSTLTGPNSRHCLFLPGIKGSFSLTGDEGHGTGARWLLSSPQCDIPWFAASQFKLSCSATRLLVCSEHPQAPAQQSSPSTPSFSNRIRAIKCLGKHKRGPV